MFKILQCVVQGISHVMEDTPCQDATYSITNDNCTVIALADGAGSARYSHYGAGIITRWICEYFSKNFDVCYSQDGFVFRQKICTLISDSLLSLANEMKCQVTDLASTLLVAAICEDRFIILQIGDGVVGYMRNNELSPAAKPVNGEFANTTVFTTSAEAADTMNTIKGSMKDIDGFVLISDGTAACMYDNRRRILAPALQRLMKLAQHVDSSMLENKLKYSFENVVKQKTGDDCSIALVMKERSFRSMTETEKVELLKIKNIRTGKKRMRKFERLLKKLQKPCSACELSKYLHIKPAYALNHIEHLASQHLIEENKGLFSSLIRL